MTKALGIHLLIVFAGLSLGCSIFREPRAATDPEYIAAHEAEKRHWEGLAHQTYMGMTRAELEQLLPPDTALRGIGGIGSYKSKGSTRPEAHIESWYYVSPYFICDIEYDFTGLNYDPPQYNPATDQVEGPSEFPSPCAAGSDPSQQKALRRARIILVEPSRVKKRK